MAAEATRRRRWMVAAGLAAVGGAALWLNGSRAAVPWGADGAAPGRFAAGVADTARNDGYLPAAQMSAVEAMPVQSYTVRVRPGPLGVQFLGVSAAALRSARVSVAVTMPDGATMTTRPLLSANGLAAYQPPGGWRPGRWRLRLGAPALSFLSWTVTVPPAVPPPPTAMPTGAATALTVLNGARQSLGLPSVHWAGALALAAAWHAAYLAQNGLARPSFHVEEPGPGFTGRLPWDRDLAAGWADGDTGEVGIAAPTPLTGGTVMAALLDTVYHRLALLAGKLTALGYGAAAGGRTAAAIANLGYQYPPTLRLAVAYPGPGQRGVPTAWLDNESPDPVPAGDGVYGYPVTLDYPTVNRLGRTSLLLVGPSGPVPAWVDAPGAGDMDPNQVALVPRRPLAPNTWYTVMGESADALFMNGRRRPVGERWRFRTGAGDQSVFVDASRRRVVVAVDDAASDMVAAGVPLTVAFVPVADGGRLPSSAGPARPGRLQRMRGSGAVQDLGLTWKEETVDAVTAPDGLATLAVPSRVRGPYRVVATTASGGMGVAAWPGSS